jgi:nucleoside-diphosphate-sugar epimerase
VGSHPADRVWRVNARSPRIAVEAAAAEDVHRVVLTSSVAGIGPAAPGETGSEDDYYRGGGLGLGYPDAKHEGEAEALAAGARHGVEVVIVNPWVELFERVAELSGVRHPLLVLPREAGAVARAAEAAGLPSPVSAERLVLMAQNWRYSSAKARRELGYRARALDRTLADTIDWYRDLIDSGTLAGARPSALSIAAAGMRVAERTGALGVLRIAERYLGRRLVAP